ncbi:MAG: hypothetical protein ACTSWC_14190 [Promethearchaeota archaeon]
MKRERTKTQSFGGTKREGHDATQFYSSRLYDGIPKEKKCKIIDNSEDINEEYYGKILEIEDLLSNLPEESIHLIILKISDKKIDQIDVFIEKIAKLISNLRILLINGGRLVVIIHNEYKERFFPLHSFIIPNIIKEGYLMRGEVILSYNNERISDRSKIKNNYDHGVVFSKNIYGRKKRDKKNEIEKTDTIERDDFIKFTKSIWNCTNEIKHWLKYLSRFLELYSFKEDSILILSDNNLDEFNKKCEKIRNNIIFSKI